VHRFDRESGGELSDRRQIGDVEERRSDSVVSSGFGYLRGDLASGVESADTEDDGCACSRQRARSLHPDAGGGAGDDGAPPRQVDIGKDVGSRGRGSERRLAQSHRDPLSLISYVAACIAATTSAVRTTPWARKA
jgi:hypothetical protein